MPIGHSWPHSLDTAQVDNLSPAVAETGRILAGRARWLYEMATGESAVSTEAPYVPVNPQGLYGVDHSGPPYGVALQHAIVSFGRGISTNVAGGASPTYWTDLDKETVDTDNARTYTARFWCKPSNGQYGPYSYGFLQLSAIRTGGSTVTVTADVENLSVGLPANSADLTLSTASLTTSSTLVRCPLQPGWNSVRLTITADGECYINSASINQVSPFRDP